MKRLIIAAVGVFLVSKFACAQPLDSTLATYAETYAQERCYIHYDKTSYLPGETIWFKAYLMKGIFPGDESKTLYIDWTDEKGKVVFRNICPVVQAVTNGQYTLPAEYGGKYIHARAYTKWMLNFDSSFLYNRDIRILSKGKGSGAGVNTPVSAIQFFPEGGDLVAGVVNKVAFKANDQWGIPQRIRGAVQNGAGAVIDSLRVLHDGMGYFYINPKAGETFTIKWNDEQGKSHSDNLTPTKASGISMQVTLSGNKRVLTINSSATSGIGTVQVIGTLNQHEVFKFSKELTERIARTTIPTQELPSGILTLTVFDSAWNPLAERITYINNEDYVLHAEMNVTHWGLNKRARNEIQVTVSDSIPSNFSVSVTDVGIDADSSDDIVSHLLLTGDIKGRVYHPSYYFSSNNDTVSQHLDLVMLTHGWRRFKWDDVVNGRLPKIQFPRDTSYLTLSGKLYGAMNSQLGSGATIVMIMNQKNVKGKMLLLPIESNGTFNDPSMILFDTAHVYYRLSKGLEDAGVAFMENRLSPFKNNLSATGKYLNPYDTSGFSRHFELSAEALDLMKQYEGKVLENVVVKAKTKSPLQIMDEKYSSGLFSGGDGYQFDLVNDPLKAGYGTVFDYLQGKVAGLQITSSGSNTSLSWRGGAPQLYIDEVPTDVSLVSSMSVSDIAFIKVFRPPFFGGSGNAANGGIAIYTRRGDDMKSTPGKGLANNIIAGYNDIREFFSPNYGSFSPGNDKKDIRTTLYWNPQVITGTAKNSAVISFYNNDVSKSFRVVIEGMSRDGRLVHIEQVME